MKWIRLYNIIYIWSTVGSYKYLAGLFIVRPDLVVILFGGGGGSGRVVGLGVGCTTGCIRFFVVWRTGCGGRMFSDLPGVLSCFWESTESFSISPASWFMKIGSSENLTWRLFRRYVDPFSASTLYDLKGNDSTTRPFTQSFVVVSFLLLTPCNVVYS